ncbi:MAG TPA: isoprenylcysteine carboxylmethyltransferase family protein [bacterium]|nr:isoprenylcysteine carboxylmethyltransferase family protein [bacterium]
MQHYLALAAIVLLAGMVLVRSLIMSRHGTRALHFGKIDKKDFLIPPFVLFYLYLLAAAAFNLPPVSSQVFFGSPAAAWVGVALCLAGVCLMAYALVSFGRSFRVGIDTEHADRLVTTGVFSFSRNPIYVAFALVLAGQFLVLPNWILLVYLAGGVALFHRQVLREEAFLVQHYGDDYREYCRRVRRYL